MINPLKIKYMDIREQNRERAIQFAKEWNCENVSNHIIDIMVSIMCTRDKSSYSGGGFVEAVVANNLYLAMSRADTDCRNNIFLLTMCNANCYA
jgi:hypothetical protein